jgi:hypothetical protein
MIGQDRDLFLKGRRCESQGLGIGAFGYYRRVVEQQKQRFIDQVIKISNILGASEEKLASLKLARDESQFSKAMDSLKTSIPETLLIKGRNPFTLLHSALSDGLHEQSDERCLELAHHIRVILVEFAEKINSALSDDKELSEAVDRLINRPANK